MPESVLALIADFATTCNHCRAPIMWARTVTGDRMPVDVDPTEFGNIRLYRDGRRLFCHVVGTVTERRKLTLGGWALFRHHRLTCPKSEKWARGHKPSTPATFTADTEGLF